MDLFRDDAPFVERDVMAGIRALLNGSRESAPAGPLGLGLQWFHNPRRRHGLGEQWPDEQEN